MPLIINLVASHSAMAASLALPAYLEHLSKLF